MACVDIDVAVDVGAPRQPTYECVRSIGRKMPEDCVLWHFFALSMQREQRDSMPRVYTNVSPRLRLHPWSPRPIHEHIL
jgi:hypothetical protein